MRLGRLVPVALAAALFVGAGAAARAQPESDRLRHAKTLMFDKKYAEAREAWKAIRAAGGGDAGFAAYQIARCSENLGEHERALNEYGEFLAGKPADASLAEEARTSRVGLATRLYKSGKKQHLAVVQQALKDPSRTVRYFAALQLASLGSEVGQPALPVLKRIIAEETDDDLVDRAKLGILRVEPNELRDVGPGRATPRPREASWLRVRIYERHGSEPKVSINLPVALADLAFQSLPQDALRELRRKGYDTENFWERLKKMGPTEIIEIRGDDGELIKIWIE
jgi:tetratricopeptide (TPR) repeat protein